MARFTLADEQRSLFNPGRLLAAAVAALLALLVFASIPRHHIVSGINTAVGTLRPRTPPELLPPCNATATAAPQPATASATAAATPKPAATPPAVAAPEPAAPDSNATRLAGGAIPQLPQVSIPQLAAAAVG